MKGGGSAASVVRHHGRVLLRGLEEFGIETSPWRGSWSPILRSSVDYASIRAIHVLHPSISTGRKDATARVYCERTLPRSIIHLGMTHLSQMMVIPRHVRKYA